MILNLLEQKYIPLSRKECWDLYPLLALLLHDLLEIRWLYYCTILKILLSENSWIAYLCDQGKAQLDSHYMHCVKFIQQHDKLENVRNTSTDETNATQS